MNIRKDIVATFSEIELHSRYLFYKYVKKTRIESPPIFIVGCGHSGTTLLLKILGSHRNIHAINFESSIAFKPPKKQKRFVHLFNRMAVAAGKNKWVEKTPRHIHAIDILLQLFPDAHILIVMRDGRDVACSIKARLNDFEKGVLRWVDDNKAAQPFLVYQNTHLVRYEDIIEDFVGTISHALSFVGESYEPSIKDFYRIPLMYQNRHLRSKWVSHIFKSSNVKKHEQKRFEQIHKPLFNGRGLWQNEMTKLEKETFKRIAGEMLVQLNYADSNEW